ncbi:MAG: hypothetical protein MUC43_12560, partial [Pirellula sp.]|nr:hypothetical protein [Pirellula sp.]
LAGLGLSLRDPSAVTAQSLVTAYVTLVAEVPRLWTARQQCVQSAARSATDACSGSPRRP